VREGDGVTTESGSTTPVGFVLSAPDNGSFMLRGDAPHPACPTCGLATAREWVDPAFRLTGLRRDASYTYDGYFVVSDRFVAVVGQRAATFVDLPAEPGFFAVVPQVAVEFDSERRGTRFEDLCSACGRHGSVAGATPAFLLLAEPLPDAIARTDVEFGSGDERHPLLLVSPDLASRLVAAALTGVELSPVAPS
jgi:hypothetical protein